MKVQDLFIGALVKFDDEIVVVRGIDNVTGRSHIDIKVYNGEYFTTVAIGKLQPIPLTAEILRKNGIIHISEIEDDVEFSGYYSYADDDSFSIDLEKAMSSIHYVHQLQALFNLAGFDKGIIIITL